MRWWMLPLLVLAILVIHRYGAESHHLRQQQQAQSHFLAQLQQSADTLDPHLLDTRRQRGEALLLSGERILTELDVSLILMKDDAPMAASYGWSDKLGRTAMLTAPGLDWQQHFANSYLVGVRPFVTDNDWLPLYSLAQRKTYQTDELQYSGRMELWQNSAQAWQLLRGDCEDHAILLADWLISEGIDARVVVGKYGTEGHAWVVAFRQDQAFLLEATDKRVGKSWNHYPLASLNKNYFPELMFNRDSFWTNVGPLDNGDYQGEQWQISATFKKSTVEAVPSP
jgi:hypothetical protein